MRKTTKSTLSALLRSKVTPESSFPEETIFVIDGGYLLHCVVWPSDATYKQVCKSYVSYTVEHYGSTDTTVVFDGYGSQASTKSVEQHRRASKLVSRDILFDADMKTMTSQTPFLANGSNKSRLIEMLSDEFRQSGVTVKQAEADADSLMISTALLMNVTDTVKPSSRYWNGHRLAGDACVQSYSRHPHAHAV